MGDMKVGNAHWEQFQLQQLSDVTMQMEQYRLSQCSNLDTLLKLKPQPVHEITSIIKDISKQNLALQQMYSLIPQSGKQGEALGTADKIKNDIQVPNNENDGQEPQNEKTEHGTPQSNGQDSSTANKDAADLRSQIQSLSTLLKNAHFDSYKCNRERVEIVVSGFSPGSVALDRQMEEELRTELKSSLNYYTESDTLTIDVIGYADNTGQPNKNIILGLERAKTVVSFLSENKIVPLSNFRLVASAGASDLPPIGRKVMLFLSFQAASS